MSTIPTRLVRLRLRLSLAALALAVPLTAQQPRNSTPSTRAATATAPATQPRLTLEEIAFRLPQRVKSKDGTPGDMVNFLFVGSKEQVQAALKTAGWVPVDRDVRNALSHALDDVLSHRAYSQMPMSPLYLFGRPQDFGYAEGIPLEIMQNRNHFRIWEAPWLTEDGQTVWVGTGTHDLGFERDSAGQLTHAIDPDVDHEREYILQTLRNAGGVKQEEYLVPRDPLRQGLTATGDKFTSDGRVLAIFLK